jgi:transglutaminase-like putative cysteine protease
LTINDFDILYSVFVIRYSLKCFGQIDDMPLFKIQHITKYEYDRPVRESANQIKIFPFAHPQQELHSQKLLITGEPSVNLFPDYWGNTVGMFVVNEPHKTLIIDSQLIINVKSAGNFNPIMSSKFNDWEILRGMISSDLKTLDYSKPESIHAKEEITAMIQDLRHNRDTPAMFIQRCSEYIFDKFEYKKGITNVETTVDEILEYKSGVCQDFAHVLLEMLRSVSIPARYVSGYICPNQDGARGAGATHAWVEVYFPSMGWVGIDPTNNLWVSDQHVVLAVGRHFNDCSPVKGTFKGPANQNLSVFVSVGYEDGHIFEEHNAVKMTYEQSLVPLVDLDAVAQQQQ